MFCVRFKTSRLHSRLSSHIKYFLALSCFKNSWAALNVLLTPCVFPLLAVVGVLDEKFRHKNLIFLLLINFDREYSGPTKPSTIPPLPPQQKLNIRKYLSFFFSFSCSTLVLYVYDCLSVPTSIDYQSSLPRYASLGRCPP